MSAPRPQPPGDGATRAVVRRARPSSASTGELIGQLTDQFSRLVRDEVRLAQAEVTQKAKRLGIGAGLFGGAGIVAVLGLGALVAAASSAWPTCCRAGSPRSSSPSSCSGSPLIGPREPGAVVHGGGGARRRRAPGRSGPCRGTGTSGRPRSPTACRPAAGPACPRRCAWRTHRATAAGPGACRGRRSPASAARPGRPGSASGSAAHGGRAPSRRSRR